MCSYKSLLPQSYSQYSQTDSRTRQECAATSPYCLSPAVSQSQTGRRTRQECAATSPYCLSPAVATHRQREELDSNVQLQVLIASVPQLVLTDREKNQIGMCSYKFLLPQPCSWYSQTERRTKQECAATSPYCLSPTVSIHRQRVELDRNVELQLLIASALQLVAHRQREELHRNVELQVLIASALQSVLTDREQNYIGMHS